MTKEFIPYQQGLQLKELGFDEPCWAWWHIEDCDTRFCYSDQRSPITNSRETEIVGLPTYSQAFRFFRDKYNLQGYIYSTTVRGSHTKGKHFSDYCWHINGIDKPFISTDPRDMENISYEEAEQACLTKLIEIIDAKIKNRR